MDVIYMDFMKAFDKVPHLRLLVKFQSYTDTPQFREGNPYFSSENPYKSVSFIYASIYRENVHAIHIAMQFAKKSRHCVLKIDSQHQKNQHRSFTSRGATVGLGLRL